MDISLSATQLKERKLLRDELLSRVVKRKEIKRSGKRRRLVRDPCRQTQCNPVIRYFRDIACFRYCLCLKLSERNPVCKQYVV